MDLLKKAKNRVEQTVSESIGSATKTEYDAHFQALLAKADDIKTQTEKLLAAFEQYIQPDAATRLLPGFVGDGKNRAELVSQQMAVFIEQMSKWANKKHPEFDNVLIQGQKTFNDLGRGEREYLMQVGVTFLEPVKRFLAADVKALENERKKLNTARVDMDSAKNKAAKNPEVKPEADRATAAFNEQQETVKKLVDQVEDKLPELQKALKQYVAVHLQYLRSAQQALESFQEQLE